MKYKSASHLVNIKSGMPNMINLSHQFKVDKVVGRGATDRYLLLRILNNPPFSGYFVIQFNLNKYGDKMEKVFKRKERLTIVSDVLDQIRDAIKSGKIKPGDRIIEADLAKDMGISRFPIREAIRYLEKEGLVITTPFKGAYVAEYSVKDLEEIYTLRIALEEAALRTLFKNLDSKKIAKLESVVGKMKQIKNGTKIDEVVDLDLSFHRTICELSENKRLLEAWLNLSNQLKTFISIDGRLYGNDTPIKTLETHYPVFEAIKKGECSLSVKLLKKCIERGYKNIMEFKEGV